MKKNNFRSATSEMTLQIISFLMVIVTCHVLLVADSPAAGIRDRVIAFVDNQAITMSDLEEHYSSTVKLSPGITKGEVLNTMINRILLLREAKQYRIEAATQDEVMREYIDLKIRAFIRVNDADIEEFYNANMKNFQGKNYEDVRDEIDMFLTEKELNERLKETLNDLRNKTYIRIYLDKE